MNKLNHTKEEKLFSDERTNELMKLINKIKDETTHDVLLILCYKLQLLETKIEKNKKKSGVVS